MAITATAQKLGPHHRLADAAGTDAGRCWRWFVTNRIQEGRPIGHGTIDEAAKMMSRRLAGDAGAGGNCGPLTPAH
jgi:hypothetical protein